MKNLQISDIEIEILEKCLSNEIHNHLSDFDSVYLKTLENFRKRVDELNEQ